MTQVLHTPLGQPIFVGDSAQTTSLLKGGLPLHLLPQTQQIQVAGLQARPRTAPVAGKKVETQASVQPKETWAKPRPVELPSKPVKELRASSAKTIKPVPQPKPSKKASERPAKPPAKVPLPVEIRVEVPLAAAPQFTAEEPVKTQQISEILAEAKRKAKEAKDRELFEAERQRQEVQAKQQRLQQLEAVAEARRSESLKADTRHPLPWGANQHRQLEEQQRIKDCALLRKEERARRPPLPQDRVGLADILEIKREVNQPVVKKKQPTPPPVRPSIKEVDPEVQQFMQEKQRRERLRAQEAEQERQQQDMDRLVRLKELETLHRAKLQSYKAQRPAPKKTKAQRKRIKQILARARAKIQSSSEPQSQEGQAQDDQEEDELEDDSELSAIHPESDLSEEPLKPTNLSTPRRETDSTDAHKAELQVVSVMPAAFLSEASRQADEMSIAFQAREQIKEMDLKERKAEVKRKLAALQQRIAGHLDPPASPAAVTVIKQFPEEPVVMDQQMPGVSSLDRVLKAEQPVPVTIETEIPGASKLPASLSKPQAIIRIQTSVRAFLARRLAARLRVRRSIALDPELQQQLDAYDKGALAILEKAYITPKFEIKLAESKVQIPESVSVKNPPKTPEPKPASVKFSMRKDDDHYSLFKVILRTGAFQPVQAESSIREETPEYSESFETPSKSSQELSSRPAIKEQIFEDSQSSRRSIPEDLRATPTDHYSSPSSKALFSSEELPSVRLRPEFSDKFLQPSESIPEDLDRKSSEQSISERFSVADLSKSSRRKEDVSASKSQGRQAESISEHLSVSDLSKSYGKPDSSRKVADSISEHISEQSKLDSSRKAPPSVTESISEQLSAADLSKSYGKPDSSRKVANSVSEHISEESKLDSSRKAPSSLAESISEQLSVADLSKSYGKPDSSRKVAESISEHLSDQSKYDSSHIASSSLAESISEQLSVNDLSKSYGKPESGRRLAESISEEISSEQSKSTHRAPTPLAGSISEQLDFSRSESKSKTSEHISKALDRHAADSISEHLSDQSSKKADSEELSHSQLSSSRKPYTSVEESIVEEDISEESEKEQSSGSAVSKGRPKYDSPGVLPEEIAPEESIAEELSHAHLSTESFAKASAREKSDNIKTVEDYSEDFESEGLAVSGRPKEEISEHISEPSEKSENYSSDFDSASHKRFDSISQEHQLKQSIEEENIEEELSQEDNYEDDFESASGSHEDETLRTSSSLPRSTIGGDVEASQASDSVEWEIELPAPMHQVIPEEVAEDIQTESDEEEDEREEQADQQTEILLQQLLTETFALVRARPPEPKFEPLLPSLPPLPQKKVAVALLSAEQLASQDLTTTVSELLDQALKDKAVLKTLASPVLRTEGLLEQLQSESVAPAVLSGRFLDTLSMQAELLESGSLTEEFQTRKPLMKAAFEVVNEILGRLRPRSRLPWEAPSKPLTPAQVRNQVETEIATMLSFQTEPSKDSLNNLAALQKLRDEKTAKMLEHDVRGEGWGAYDAQEAAVQFHVAESLLRVLAGEVAEVLGRCA